MKLNSIKNQVLLKEPSSNETTSYPTLPIMFLLKKVSLIYNISFIYRKMSNRPSDNYRNRPNCPDNTTDYAVFGNTVAAIMHIIKLRKQGVTTTINLITSNHDNTKMSDVDSLEFIMKNAKTILHTLLSEKIHYIGTDDCGNSCYPNLNLDHYFVSRDVYYTHGLGPLGDVISSYIVGHFGPWFHKSNSNSSKIQPYVNTYTTKEELNPKELDMMQKLSDIWEIPATDSVVVNEPSILCKKYILKKQHGYKFIRQLFKSEFNYIKSQCNVKIHTLKEPVHFSESTVTPGNYDLNTYNWGLENVRVVFKTNPYAYLALTSRGDLCPDPIDIPTFYRAIVPVAKSGSGNLRNANKNLKSSNASNCGCPGSNQVGSTNPLSCNKGCPSSDVGLISHNTFSLPDLDACNQSSDLVWAGQCYLCSEDYFPTNQYGWFADGNHDLLVVECVNYLNKRSVSFNKNDDELSIAYNHRRQEEKYLYQFAKIVTDIIRAHNGSTVTPESLLQAQDFNISNGSAMQSNYIENISMRESSLTILLEMIAGLYGGEHYVPY